MPLGCDSEMFSLRLDPSGLPLRGEKKRGGSLFLTDSTLLKALT